MYGLRFLTAVLLFASCRTARFANKTVLHFADHSELKDTHLYLFANGRFLFQERYWLVVTVRGRPFTGNYIRKGDTVQLYWNAPAPATPGLSSSAFFHQAGSELRFLDTAGRVGKTLWLR